MKVARTEGRSRRRRALRGASAAALVCLATALAGCGAVSALRAWIPWEHHGQAHESAAVRHPVRPPVNRDMVRAVGDAADDGVPVEVRFALRARPKVGHPAKLDLELVPSAPLDKVVASYHAQAGLEVAQGDKPTETDHPKPGVPINHKLILVAQRDGIFCVTATVLVDSPRGSIARTFTIPVIAGDGLH